MCHWLTPARRSCSPPITWSRIPSNTSRSCRLTRKTPASSSCLCVRDVVQHRQLHHVLSRLPASCEIGIYQKDPQTPLRSEKKPPPDPVPLNERAAGELWASIAQALSTCYGERPSGERRPCDLVVPICLMLVVDSSFDDGPQVALLLGPAGQGCRAEDVQKPDMRGSDTSRTWT